MKTKVFEDPIVAEVSLVKDRLAAQFDYDVVAMLHDAQKREKAHGRRVVDFSKPQPAPVVRKAKPACQKAV